MYEIITNGFRHVQSTTSTTWNVQHNLHTSSPVVDCWIDQAGTLTKIIPLSVDVVDEDNVTITFSSVRAGEAFVV